MPISGLNTGMSVTFSVHIMASSVWEATWPMLSPVTRQLQRSFSATFAAMRIMKRRIITVPRPSSHFSCISSWGLVKGTMCTFMPYW